MELLNKPLKQMGRLSLARQGGGSLGVVTRLSAESSMNRMSNSGRRKRFFSSKLSGWLEVYALAYVMSTVGFFHGDKIART
jgi:hypothetical protein